jgi:FkbM family methyltransferase
MLKRLVKSLLKILNISVNFELKFHGKHSETLKKYNTLTGVYFLPKFAFSDIIAKQIKKNKIYDREIYLEAKKFIRKESIVIDIGSNFGQLSILFSKLYKDVEVHSFEASKFIYNILKKNIEANDANVIAYNLALTDNVNEKIYEPIIKFKDCSTYGAYPLINSKNNLKKNRIISNKLDNINFIKKISFIKIDTQGMDLKVMKGAKRIITQNQCPVIFEYEEDLEKKHGHTFQDVVNFVKEINYSFYKVIYNINYLIVPNKYKL